jgi:hypothetical protein
LGDALRLESVPKRPNHRILTHQIDKGLGAILAGKYLVCCVWLGIVAHECSAVLSLLKGKWPARQGPPPVTKLRELSHYLWINADAFVDG